MSEMNILVFGLVVFGLMLIGAVLTVMEFSQLSDKGASGADSTAEEAPARPLAQDRD